MKKPLLILTSLLLLAGCGPSEAEKEFNASGRAKAIEDKTDLWMVYEDTDAGFTIRYPHSVTLGEDLIVESDPIETLEGTMGYNRETALKNQKALQDGEYGDSVDFALDASQRVRPIDGTSAQEFMVLGRFEVCDVTFERKLYFFNNDHQVVITLLGSQDEIMQSSSVFFATDNNNCGDMMIWDFEKQDDFYRTLSRGNGSEVAQNWFNDFDAIIDTLSLSD